MPLPRKETLANGIELHLGDFREWLPYGVDDFHHLISDPPYEQRSQDAFGSIRRADGVIMPDRLEFQGIDDLRDDLLIRAKMKCSGWLLAFCTTEGVASWRDAIEKHGLKYKTPMIWSKPDSTPKLNGQGPSHGHECIASAWCGLGYAKWSGGGRGLFTHNCNWPGRVSFQDGGHPTAKPPALMMELVALFSDPGQTICDPFMGTGTTGEACIRLGRKFIGIEQNPKWFTYACRRLENALKQADLFVEHPKFVQTKMEI